MTAEDIFNIIRDKCINDECARAAAEQLMLELKKGTTVNDHYTSFTETINSTIIPWPNSSLKQL